MEVTLNKPVYLRLCVGYSGKPLSISADLLLVLRSVIDAVIADLLYIAVPYCIDGLPL